MLYCGLKIEVAFTNTSKSMTFPRVQVSKKEKCAELPIQLLAFFAIPVSVQSVC